MFDILLDIFGVQSAEEVAGSGSATSTGGGAIGAHRALSMGSAILLFRSLIAWTIYECGCWRLGGLALAPRPGPSISRGSVVSSLRRAAGELSRESCM